MKNMIRLLLGRQEQKLIARFGRAMLVGLPDGSLELRGGGPGDLAEAKEWVSLFMHEGLLRKPSAG